MSYKSFDLASDVASVVSAINEVVTVSSSIFIVDANVKMFANIASASYDYPLGGYFQTAYDASPTSSLSTPLFDLTYGYTTASLYNAAVTVSSSQNEKVKIYRHFSNMLLGDFNSTFTINSTAQQECFFMTIKRSLAKDEIKKGTVSVTFLSGATYLTASDVGAATSFKQTLGGDYAALKYAGTGSEYGQIWYNAGVVVMSPSLMWDQAGQTWSGSITLENIQYSGCIDQAVNGLRGKVEKVAFHNQTNLYSSIYFCRLGNTEFNYSSNPTFIDDNKRIRVTSGSTILQTRTYVTTIGLYDANDNLLAISKLNKPITKSPDSEAIYRIRLDY